MSLIFQQINNAVRVIDTVSNQDFTITERYSIDRDDDYFHIRWSGRDRALTFKRIDIQTIDGVAPLGTTDAVLTQLTTCFSVINAAGSGGGGGGVGDASAANQVIGNQALANIQTNTQDIENSVGLPSDPLADSTINGTLSSRIRSALAELEDIQDVLGGITDPSTTHLLSGTVSSRLRYISEKLNNIDLDIDSLLNVNGTVSDIGTDFTVNGTLSSRLRYISQEVNAVKTAVQNEAANIGTTTDSFTLSTGDGTLLARTRGLQLVLESLLQAIGSFNDPAIASNVSGTLLSRQRGIHVSLDDVRSNVGATSNGAATTDIGNFSLIALIKRGLTNWTSLLSRFGLVSGPASDSVSPATLLDRQWGIHQSLDAVFTEAEKLNTISGVITDPIAIDDSGNHTKISLFKRISQGISNIRSYQGAINDPVAGSPTSNESLMARLKYIAQEINTTRLSMTNGTQLSIGRGGAKGTTVAADVTSSNIDANTQAWDVSVKQDLTQGTNATGVTMPAGGAGLLGWLSGIYSRLSNTLTIKQELSTVTPGAVIFVTLAVNTASAGTTVPAGAKYMYIGFRGTQPLFYSEDGSTPTTTGVGIGKFIPQNGFIIEDQVESIPRGANLRFISSAVGTVIIQFRS